MNRFRSAIPLFSVALVTWNCGPGERTDSDQTAGAASQAEVVQDSLAEEVRVAEGLQPARPRLPTPDMQPRALMVRPDSGQINVPVTETVLRLQGSPFQRDSVGDPLNSYLVTARINPATMRPRIIGVTPKQPDGQSIRRAIRDLSEGIAIGGGFMSLFTPPTPAGLLIVDGSVISALNPRDPVLSTVLVVRNGEIELVEVDRLGPEGISGAIQLGPRLVRNGEVVIFEEEPRQRRAAKRVFLGVGCGELGEMVGGITEQPVHLYHLARYISAQGDADGLGCADAVNLSGGGMEGLAIKWRGGTQYFGNHAVRHSSMLIFERR